MSKDKAPFFVVLNLFNTNRVAVFVYGTSLFISKDHSGQTCRKHRQKLIALIAVEQGKIKVAQTLCVTALKGLIEQNRMS